jgi:hypothetical protein
MAKGKGGGSPQKLSFGKRKAGKAKKSFNKHDRKSRVYKGQGR